MSDKLTLAVASGTGDISWLISRVWSVRDEIGKIEVADGYPRRSHQYMELLPFEYSYEPHDYNLICQMEQMHGYSHHTGSIRWETIRNLGHQRIFIESNQWLEAGKPLAEWIDDIPPQDTYFHYPLLTSNEHKAKAAKRMALLPKDKPAVGISCASYRGAEAWRTWKRPEWIECISRMLAEGWHPVFIGAKFDDLTMDVALHFGEEFPAGTVSDWVGKQEFGEVVEAFRTMPAYIGYSSGLNVIRTVLNKPAMALWPDYEGFSQEALSRSWAPPHMQEWESGRYIARLWRPIDDVWPTMKKFLRTCGEEIGKTLEPPCK